VKKSVTSLLKPKFLAVAKEKLTEYRALDDPPTRSGKHATLADYVRKREKRLSEAIESMEATSSEDFNRKCKEGRTESRTRTYEEDLDDLKKELKELNDAIEFVRCKSSKN
jgi:uncharacterized protein (DUF2344 family)